MMQDVMLCVSFYIHESVFTSEVNTSWRLDGSTYIDPSVYPLPTVFKLIEMKPYQNASFTPEELNSRKRLFSIKESTVGIKGKSLGKYHNDLIQYTSRNTPVSSPSPPSTLDFLGAPTSTSDSSSSTPLSREASSPPPPNVDQGLFRLAAGVEVAAGLLAIVVIVVGFCKWFRSHYPHENDAQTL
ncbi:hypothetical protein K1719_009530 [Acacia pycnantha]|nr:hypothetical protein K1719_009530 [Acacia pycnantha]